MNQDIFDPLFQLQDHRLAKLGNPLIEIDKIVKWSDFKELLDLVHEKKRKSNAGAKTKDVLMIFKGLIIQSLYGLSDDQLEFQIEDRRSFQTFLGLSKHQRSPDSKTFWTFRNSLSKLDLSKRLFDKFSKQINAAGFIARKGQIVDASIIPAPIQRNKRKENEEIKAGDTPKDWSVNKKSQKDTDARWTRKHNKNYFGYKDHIQIDNKHKVIRDYTTTDASVHDSQVFDDILDKTNTNKCVWADSAYKSKEQENTLLKNGYKSRIQRKGKRGKPLSKLEIKGNNTRSKTRSRVEHVFGSMTDLRNKSVRCIGIQRAKTEIGLMNLAYNIRRMCFLCRVNPF